MILFTLILQLAVAAPILKANDDSHPEKLVMTRAADVEEMSKALSLVMNYVVAAPKDTLPPESVAYVKKVVTAWMVKPSVNPFATDPVFKATVDSLPPLWASESAGKVNVGQILSCKSAGDFTPANGVLRFYDLKSGEHRLLSSLKEGCAGDLRLEGRAFSTIKAGVAGTVTLNRCRKSDKQFVSTSSSCEGGSRIGTLGAMYPSARAGLVPLYSATHKVNGYRLISTDLEEYEFADQYAGRKIIGYVVPATLTPLPTINLGLFRVKGSSAVRYSSGDGYYCAVPPSDVLELGGKNSYIQNVDRIPAGMVSAGACVLPVQKESFFFTTSPGPSKLPQSDFSGWKIVGQGRLPGQKAFLWIHGWVWYTNGGNLVCDLKPTEYFSEKVRRPSPFYFTAEQKMASLKPGLIYVGRCKDPG